MADDFGRLHDNLKVIDAFIFPTTDDTARESLATLSRMVRIRRGKSSSGQPIIEIVNWSRHQRVDKPQDKSALPPIAVSAEESLAIPTGNSIRESFANDSGTAIESFAPRPTTNDLLPGTNDQGGDRTTATIRRKPPPLSPKEFHRNGSFQIDWTRPRFVVSSIDFRDAKAKSETDQRLSRRKHGAQSIR